jgi:steroid 5-alpha reductase family enzyme
MEKQHFVWMSLAPLILIHLFYFIAVRKKNLSVIDTAWGLGFVLIALTGCWQSSFKSLHENLIMIMVFLWGLRLSVFLHFRNKDRPEDYRYAQWRKDWGERVNQIAYFKVYLLQWLLMLIVSLPLFGVHGSASPIKFTHGVGFILWSLGLIWESVADYQKSKFKSQPGHENRLCQVGLWRLSRHPNYFGEILLWWGIGVAALHDHNYWVLLGPGFINFLLLKVSGVPLIEARHLNNADYQAYKNVTPTLIPSVTKLWK